VGGESLIVLCLLLFADGATTAAFTTPLLLKYARHHEPWHVALAGGASTRPAARWLSCSAGCRAAAPMMKRFIPSRE
jgi:hypothetical protein